MNPPTLRYARMLSDRVLVVVVDEQVDGRSSSGLFARCCVGKQPL